MARAPTTPTQPCTSISASTLLPPRNTPSKLSQFLEFAETTLNVKNACVHEESLRMLGFGPDILYLVDNTVLKDVGFTPEDVICLKQNLQQWWNSADTKHKWTNQSPSSAVSTPPNKRVTFKKQYRDGGGYRVYGPRIAEGDFSPDADVEWFYLCKARGTMVPLPFGCVPFLNGEEGEAV
jgi:hypothetical protein